MPCHRQCIGMGGGERKKKKKRQVKEIGKVHTLGSGEDRTSVKVRLLQTYAFIRCAHSLCSGGKWMSHRRAGSLFDVRVNFESRNYFSEERILFALEASDFHAIRPSVPLLHLKICLAPAVHTRQKRAGALVTCDVNPAVLPRSVPSLLSHSFRRHESLCHADRNLHA